MTLLKSKDGLEITASGNCLSPIPERHSGAVIKLMGVRKESKSSKVLHEDFDGSEFVLLLFLEKKERCLVF